MFSSINNDSLQKTHTLVKKQCDIKWIFHQGCESLTEVQGFQVSDSRFQAEELSVLHFHSLLVPRFSSEIST
jgi:hypothetical protein